MATNDSYIPAEYNTGIVRGDYFEERFQLSVDDISLDLSDASAKIQLRSLTNVKVGEYTISTDNTTKSSCIRISDDNIMMWIINEDDTAMFAPGIYKYAIQITISGKVRTYVRGQFTVERDIAV